MIERKKKIGGWRIKRGKEGKIRLVACLDVIKVGCMSTV